MVQHSCSENGIKEIDTLQTGILRCPEANTQTHLLPLLGSQGAFIATSKFLVEGMTSEGHGSRNRKCVFTDETKLEQRAGLR